MASVRARQRLLRFSLGARLGSATPRQRLALFGCEALQALIARLVAGAVGGGVGALLGGAGEQRLALAEALDQRDLAGTDEIAATALDAIEQSVGLQRRGVGAACEPVKLLRQ